MTKSSLALYFITIFFIGEITILLPMVCPKNTLPTRDLSSVCLQLLTSVKNKGKFVFLLAFYVSLLLNYKKLKNQEKKKRKKRSIS